MRPLVLVSLFLLSRVSASGFDFSRLERPLPEPGEIARAFKEASSFTEERDWKQALSSWRDCAKVWTDAAEPYYNMGLCIQYTGGDVQDIVACYDGALKRKPCRPLTRYIAHNKGVALMGDGQVEEGLKLVSIAGGKDRAKRIDAFLLAAHYCEIDEQWQEAADHYRKAREIWVQGKTRLADWMREKDGKDLLEYLALRCESHIDLAHIQLTDASVVKGIVVGGTYGKRSFGDAPSEEILLVKDDQGQVLQIEKAKIRFLKFEPKGKAELKGNMDLLQKIRIKPFCMGTIRVPQLLPLSKAYFAEDKTEQGIQRAEMSMQLSPEDMDLDWWAEILTREGETEEAAEVTVDLGLELAKDQEWDKAKAAAEKALSLHPGCSRAEAMQLAVESSLAEIAALEAHGPWSFEVVSWTQTQNYVVEIPNGEISFDAKGNEVVALVEVQCTRLRDDYTDGEYKALQSHWSWEPFKTAMGFCGKETVLGTPCFTLMYNYLQGSQDKVMVSQCLSMESVQGLNTFYFNQEGQAVGCTDDDTVKILLIFGFDPSDEDPLLLFEPVPEGPSKQAARLILGEGDTLQVEYGDPKDLAKRSFPEGVFE